MTAQRLIETSGPLLDDQGCLAVVGWSPQPLLDNNLDFKAPWTMRSPDGRLDLTFTPFFERVAKTDLKVLSSEVHQMFGRYHGTVYTDGGEPVQIDNLVGWAEEHRARW